MTTHRTTPMLSMSVHVELDALKEPLVYCEPEKVDRVPDRGRVTLVFGDGTGDVRVTLAASAWDLRRAAVMLDQAALELERQWADHPGSEAELLVADNEPVAS